MRRMPRMYQLASSLRQRVGPFGEAERHHEHVTTGIEGVRVDDGVACPIAWTAPGSHAYGEEGSPLTSPLWPSTVGPGGRGYASQCRLSEGWTGKCRPKPARTKG